MAQRVLKMLKVQDLDPIRFSAAYAQHLGNLKPSKPENPVDTHT